MSGDILNVSQKVCAEKEKNEVAYLGSGNTKLKKFSVSYENPAGYSYDQYHLNILTNYYKTKTKFCAKRKS